MSSLADELVLLRLHEARSNASTEFKNQDGQAAASGLAARRRAVRSSSSGVLPHLIRPARRRPGLRGRCSTAEEDVPASDPIQRESDR